MSAPSRSGWQGYQGKRVCAGCGEKVVVSGKQVRELWFETLVDPRGNSRDRVWHFACKPGAVRFRREVAAEEKR